MNSQTMNPEEEWIWSKDTLKAIIARIVERDNDREGEEDNEFNEGRHAAYFEILDMIQNDLIVRGCKVEEFFEEVEKE
ncbi:MAG: hypothetical protein Q4A78_08620 [Peptostreptococcaceae bacterium]|nr:hypothetical protein [Peptostreptococcaceae bacterium]